MMNKSTVRGIAFVSVACALLVVLSLTLSIEYKITSKAFFLPAAEYTITRTLEGNLISSLIDHKTDVVERYSVTEFQRGDVVELIMSPHILNKSFVSEGDTIGYLLSNEEQRNLIDMEGQLEILKAELLFYTTGQKPEDVLLALSQMELAEQELATQRILMERSERIYAEGAISTQEYDLEINALRTKELAAKIARANWLSITTGEKPEQEKLTLAQMAALSRQIEQIRKRLNSLTIISPVSGKIILHRDLQLNGQIITIADTSCIVGLIPVPIDQRGYIYRGSEVKSGRKSGTILRMDNTVKMIDNRQAFYVTAIFPWETAFLPGTIERVQVQAGQLSLMEYLGRVLGLDRITMS